MAWLSRVNFTASDVLSYTDLNNLGNDIRAWGGNVNGGAYTLSNVVLSASSGTMATVIGGTGTTSTLTLRSTSGVGTTGADIVFQTGNNGATEVMRLQNGGNVGIGAPSPGEKLVVVGNIVAGNTGTTADGYIDIDGGPTGKVRISRTGTGATASGMVFYTQFSTLQERMRIDASGNVSINTTTSGSKLQVVGTASLGSGSLNSFGSGYSGTITGSQGKATAADNNNFALMSNDALASNPLTLAMTVVGNPTATSRYAIISCSEYGTGNYRSLALQPYGGNVGIGTLSPSYLLQLSNDSAAKPTTNTWTIASDSRLKTVKGEYQKGLAEICQVRPVRYEYNGRAGFIADGRDKVSILAQELMQVFPECVDTFKGKLEEDGPEIDLYNYNGHAITFALINAIKELKAEIDILKARN